VFPYTPAPPSGTHPEASSATTMAKKLNRSVAASRPNRPEGGAGGSSRPAGKRPRGRRVSSQLLTDWTVQMAVLSEAGIPVVRALKILEGQARPGAFKSIQGELVEEVSGGAPLSEAMTRHGRVFDTLYTAMVRAGETGGVLDVVLSRLAYFRERAAAVRSKVVGALIYPAIVLFVALIVVTVVMLFVIPRFREVFSSFGIEMPRPTQILLGISSYATRYWYLVIGLPIALFILHGVGMSRGGKYRRWVHALTLKVPYLGTVMRRSGTAQFARTFGTLVQAGVPHLDALGITRDTTSNAVLSEAIEGIRSAVREGEAISRPMQESGSFDDLVTNMVEVGEQTGELDKMLLKVAVAYEAETERKIDALFKILEPLLLVFLAVFVGFIVISLFLPMLRIMSAGGLS
jgi:type IV pilus assembly protein PilC